MFGEKGVCVWFRWGSCTCVGTCFLPVLGITLDTMGSGGYTGCSHRRLGGCSVTVPSQAEGVAVETEGVLSGARVGSARDLPWKRVWNLRFAENMHVCGVGVSWNPDGVMMRGKLLLGYGCRIGAGSVAAQEVWT
jgi:hypothetical protein